MSEGKMTAGPWECDGFNVGKDGCEVWAGPVCRAAERIATVGRNVNATAIAALPELIEALHTARYQLYEDYHSHMSQEQFESDTTIKTIDAALAKAGVTK